MTIRARLLWLTIGLVVPLVLVGFYNLWSAWEASRTQLNDSIERQAELAATAFEQWIKAHTQTLYIISDLSKTSRPAVLKDYLNSIVKTRPQWLDVQIVSESGEVVLAQTLREKPLPLVSIETIRHEITAKKTLVIFTEQLADENLRLFSLALPVADGNFVVARIDGAGASEVFKKLELPAENTIAVFDSNSRLLYRSSASPEQMALDVSNTPLLSALNGRQRAAAEVESPYDKIRRVYGLARVETANCIVAVGVPSEKLYAPTKAQYWRQLWLGAAITSLAVFLALFIARSISEPMRLLTEAARAFGAGDRRARADVQNSGAVREVSETFNQMAEAIAAREEKLQALDRLKSEFVSSVSHELRTPLTTIKTLVRVLQRGKSDDAENAEYLQTIAAECDRQIEFVQNLLDLSRIESGAYKVSFNPTEIEKLLREVVATQQRAAASRGLNLIFDAPETSVPMVSTDPGALRRIVSNLIENAMKYTPEGGTVTIGVRAADGQIEIDVTDTGCGIDPADLPHIFEKFYRGRPLETLADLSAGETFVPNEAVGTGLGLYLTKNLVEQLEGEIRVESPARGTGAGTRLTVILPVRRAVSK